MLPSASFWCKTGVISAFLFAAASTAGCSGASDVNIGPGGSDAGVDSGQPQNDPPHALGSILLGETHSSQGGSTTPVVSAAFMPDSAMAAKSCTRTVDSCQVTDTTQSCATACTAKCAPDEECYIASPGKSACRKTQSFDAGPLAFGGTTVPITLFPPYTYHGQPGGAPFLAGASLEVQAAGAGGTGYDGFDEKFTATTFLQTSPALAKTPLATVFGMGAIPVAWVPGNDTVTISVTGAGGVASCAADDTKGSFAVPRTVAKAVMGTSSTQFLSISVERRHTDVRKSEHTHGSLEGITVQPVGFVQLVTSSLETASFQGCLAGQSMCGAQCTDTTNDNNNCGACGHVCSSGTYCTGGSCQSTCGTLTDCGGSCVDTTTDNSNCGSCGNACGTGTYCTGSTCQNTCGTLTYCSGSCVDLTSDSNNCGYCGNYCGTGNYCSSSVCQPICTGGLSFCSGACVDETTDNSNCGFCSNVCTGGATCQSGSCVAPPTCSSCESTAESGTCSSSFNACVTSTDCSNYRSCVGGCFGSSTCISSCQTSFPAGVTPYNTFANCICFTACPSSCSAACSAGDGL